MPEETFRWVVTGGVAIATLCILAMAVVAVMLYRVISKVQAKVNEVTTQAQPIIDTVRKVTGHAVPAHESPRRPGDPAVLVASSAKIKKELGWKPQYADLESIVRSAWDWRKAHPNGYGPRS